MPSSLSCPNCGAPLDLAADSVAIRCPYCNSSVIVAETLRSIRGGDSPASPTLNFGPLLSQSSALSEIARFIRAGHKIEAIKVYRQTFGGGLKEAKDAIDTLAKGQSIHIPPVVQPPAVAQASRTANLNEIARLVELGNKIEAIKIYREAFGVGLKEAKDAVEAIETGQMESGWDVPAAAPQRTVQPPPRPAKTNTIRSFFIAWGVMMFVIFWIAFIMVLVGSIFIPDSVRLVAPALCPKGYKGAHGQFYGYYSTDNFEGTNVVLLKCVDNEGQETIASPILTDGLLCGGYLFVGGIFAFLLTLILRSRSTPLVWLWRIITLAALVSLIVGVRIYLNAIPSAEADVIASHTPLAPTVAPTIPPAPTPVPPSLPYFRAFSFGSEGTGPGAFDDARAIAVDGEGRVYVGDYGGGRIQVFDSEGNFITQWHLSSDSKDLYLLGLAVDRGGTVYASYRGNIYLHDGATGELLGQIENPDDLYFDDITFTADGGLIAVADNSGLALIDSAGKIVWNVPDAMAAASGESDSISDLAADRRGNIYVVGLFSGTVYQFSPQGKFVNKIATEGDQPGQLTSPRAIAVNDEGHIFIADFNGIQAFDADGAHLGMIETEDSSIFNMAFDGGGNLWVMARNSAKVIEYVLYP